MSIGPRSLDRARGTLLAPLLPAHGPKQQRNQLPLWVLTLKIGNRGGVAAVDFGASMGSVRADCQAAVTRGPVVHGTAANAPEQNPWPRP
jgi:hypothetical protein